MSVVRHRDHTLESTERQRYRLLRYVQQKSSGRTDQAVLGRRAADDLGLSRPEAALIMDDLVRLGYLDYAGPEPSVALTEEGLDYLRRAGRRQSVRAMLAPLAASLPRRSLFERLLPPSWRAPREARRMGSAGAQPGTR